MLFSQIFYDRPPNGRVQYRMTVATVGTDILILVTIHPHTVLAPPPFVSIQGMIVFKSRPDHQEMPTGRRHAFIPM